MSPSSAISATSRHTPLNPLLEAGGEWAGRAVSCARLTRRLLTRRVLRLERGRTRRDRSGLARKRDAPRPTALRTQGRFALSLLRRYVVDWRSCFLLGACGAVWARWV